MIHPPRYEPGTCATQEAETLIVSVRYSQEVDALGMSELRSRRFTKLRSSDKR